MQSFSEFLREKERVDSRHLPHYLRWISMYREFAIGPTSGKAFGIRDVAAAASGQDRQFTAFLSFLGRSYQD